MIDKKYYKTRQKLGQDSTYERYRMEIPKECYEECNGGYLTKEWELEIFSAAQLYGYGVYNDVTKCIDGKYYLDWAEGRSCD